MTRDQLLFRLYAGIILLIVLVAVFAPLISPYDPYESAMQNSLLPPSVEHYFGTDKLGRDIFTRILYGARISITMALIVVIISAGLGTLIGVISAYIGGKVDNAIMRRMCSSPSRALCLRLPSRACWGEARSMRCLQSSSSVGRSTRVLREV